MTERRKTSENYIDTLKAKINTGAWNIPGVRHRGLSRQDFSVLATSGNFIVAPANKDTTVTHPENKGTYFFDSNGRLIRCESPSFYEDNRPITDRLEYDKFGRLTLYVYSGDGECNPANGVSERFEYPEGKPDSHYTQIIERAFDGYRTHRETWEDRQAIRVLKKSGWL